MATGERIKFIRNLRGMTQKYLGTIVGFDKKAADVRIAQYESGTRKPKGKLINDISNALEISPHALTVPKIDSYIDLMHTLFALEDLYGIKINTIDNQLCLTLDNENSTTYLSMFELFSTWQKESEKLKSGTITIDEYDDWRYNYPSHDTSQHWVKPPSQQLSDTLVKQFKDKLLDD